jgi:hypothetical protein
LHHGRRFGERGTGSGEEQGGVGEHRPARSDGRFGGALRLAVAAGFVVAAGCAALLMVGRGGDNAAASSRNGGCDRLCAAPAPTGAAGTAATAPATNPAHQGQSLTAGTATPPAGPSGTPGGTSGSQSPSKSGAVAPGTASSSPSSVSAAGRMVPFTVTAHWPTGYQVNVVVSNDGAAPLKDWKLTIHLGGQPTLTQVSSANATVGADGVLTVTPVDWDTTINPGAQVTVNFGFNGPYAPPTDCALNGQPCTLTVHVD